MAISKTHQRQEESVFDPKHSKYLNPTETLHPKEKYRMEEVLRNSHKYGDAWSSYMLLSTLYFIYHYFKGYLSLSLSGNAKLERTGKVPSWGSRTPELLGCVGWLMDNLSQRCKYL